VKEKYLWLWFILPTLISAAVLVGLLKHSIKEIPIRTNADLLTEKVVAGKVALQKYNCNDCHTFFGIGGYYAPDLTKIYRKYGDGGRELLKDVILNPEKHFTGRRMKKFNITDSEIEAMMDYLRWTSNINNNDWPPVYSEKYGRKGNGGSNLLKAKKCLLCHRYNGEGGGAGPALSADFIRKSFDSKDSLRKFIINPQSGNKDSLMLPYGGAEFTEKELDDLVKFLWEGR